LRCRDTVIVKPFLQIGFRPALVEPVAWVRSRLTSLLGDSVVVVTSCINEGLLVSGLRDRDVVLLQEGLQLRLVPAWPS
jgi:hypothetical protein